MDVELRYPYRRGIIRGLYKEYIRMKKEGYKMTYIVVFLAEKYRISERKVYTLLQSGLSQNCEPLER